MDARGHVMSTARTAISIAGEQHENGRPSLTTSVGPMTHSPLTSEKRANGTSSWPIAGEIDLATAPLLAGALRWYTECDVIVDLSAVRLLDSSGLTVLIRTQKRLRQTGHTLRTTGERGMCSR